MEDLEYTVTETVHRNQAGQIVKIDYEFDETTVIQATGSTTGMSRQNKEKRNRTYEATIAREQYESLTRQSSNALPFDAFVKVLRPFIMGYYVNDELETAFNTLDNDHSKKIQLDEFSSFLPILNEQVTLETLTDYVKKVDENFDGNLDYDEFRSLVLRGIGRDIICNHII